MQYVLSLAALLLVLSACERREAAPEPPAIDYSRLSKEERRLPENALASFTLHPGLDAELFAAEPMLINPTNLDVDERGRVWVCEAQNYRRFNHDHPAREAGDRIMILEDLDGDGRADTSKVFYQGPEVNAALGIAKLGEKVYVAASPNVLVFTDADGDDVPESLDTLFTGISGVDHDHGVHAIVFGPDGKLYFNFGNEGKQLRMASGELAKDLRGETVEEGKSHRQGMVFRCNADGSELEIMGHNFRNNFEVALDAYGRMWQSDNDDDGNEGTRINFVMDYGNYGYHDEVTGAAWQQARVGMEEEIPLRHWHLNDPGVVPNLLQTGSGSPTGILVYEGHKLPEVFEGQMIHCEPGHNVVRSYPVVADGAGFTAEVVNLMESQDQWFRPSDVCAAPDGSLLVADWYDSGVGGHLMGDIVRGRVYRLHSVGQESYTVQAPDLSDLGTAIASLGHVNQATRYLAYRRVVDDPAAARQLRATVADGEADIRLRARAAWALAEIEGTIGEIAPLLRKSGYPPLRELALRMARQYPGEGNRDLLALIGWAADREDAALWREAALGLRFLEGEEADRLFVRLANHYDGNDRWYLEALGIGSDLYAEDRFAAWLATDPPLKKKASRDLVWRSRSPEALAQLEAYIREAEDTPELARFFRALHFQPAERTAPLIERAVYTEDHPRQEELVRFALASIDPDQIRTNPRLRQRVQEVMPSLRGTDAWLLVVRNAGVISEAPILLDSALQHTDNDYREGAVKLAYELTGPAFYLERYAAADATERSRLVDLARHLHTEEIMGWLQDIRNDTTQELATRQLATRSLANMWQGMTVLLDEVKDGDLPREEGEYIARVLSQSRRADIRDEAIDWLAANRTGEAIDLDGIADRQGDRARGEAVFTEYCAACHQVNGQGVQFGPNLSRIGEKLGKDALVAAIAYPSQGIGFGYEGYELALVDGTRLVGYIESQTENELTVRMMGGVSRTVKKADVRDRRPLEESLMTAGLHTIMSEEELVDLVSYLSGLQLTK
ncbi:PVC-type heme-binding CxxCH protein [Neolewinella sp.]|uniref:PVC-type heme-binding CxxCH protein n=1 Tax=Neolewinella sp. TaxID=2993543 RepID=UPI003B52E5B5